MQLKVEAKIFALVTLAYLIHSICKRIEFIQFTVEWSLVLDLLSCEIHYRL